MTTHFGSRLMHTAAACGVATAGLGDGEITIARRAVTCPSCLDALGDGRPHHLASAVAGYALCGVAVATTHRTPGAATLPCCADTKARSAEAYYRSREENYAALVRRAIERGHIWRST